jgi:plastin-1
MRITILYVSPSLLIASLVNILLSHPWRIRNLYENSTDYKARETIKNVNVDSSGRLEVEDWVQLHSLLKAGKSQPVYVLSPHPSLLP